MATFEEILQARYSRRSVLKSAAALSGVSLLGPLLPASYAARSGVAPFPLPFNPIKGDAGADPKIPDDHTSEILLRWGDPISEASPPFDPLRQSAAAQAAQFGYNCDFVGYFPLETSPDGHDVRGLLAVNHEYTNRYLMSPDYAPRRATREEVDIELAAHGMTIVEIALGEGGRWRPVLTSPKNRRLTLDSPMLAAGPAAGHPRLQTSADPTGTHILGTLNNCAGGKTPWGTVLSGEENFQNYFINGARIPATDRDLAAAAARYQIPETDLGDQRDKDCRWGDHIPRFDLAKEPHEPFRFGWVIEADPLDPAWVPRKRTALGRFRHEGATVVHASSGHLAVYSGDDAYFEYVYKYVSAGTYDPDKPGAARDGDLLDDGVLHAARFHADGTGEWLPLVYGQGGLEGELEIGGHKVTFASQADVCIKTRFAADFAGATKMDRPEDVEASPITGKVYVALTKNPNRGKPGLPATDEANPRAENHAGHVIEITEDGGDHASRTFRWEILLLCGRPGDASTHFAGFPKEMLNAAFAGIATPDNLTFDRAGNLWIATDGQPSTKALGINDGLYALPLEGDARGHIGQFFSAVPGSEVCGPEFTPDGRTLFIAVQHPGDGEEATYADPASRWPDNDPNMPPRPTVIAVRRKDGAPISG